MTTTENLLLVERENDKYLFFTDIANIPLTHTTIITIGPYKQSSHTIQNSHS